MPRQWLPCHLFCGAAGDNENNLAKRVSDTQNHRGRIHRISYQNRRQRHRVNLNWKRWWPSVLSNRWRILICRFMSPKLKLKVNAKSSTLMYIEEKIFKTEAGKCNAAWGKDCPFKEATAGVRLSVDLHPFVANWFLNRVPRPINRKRIKPSTNSGVLQIHTHPQKEFKRYFTVRTKMNSKQEKIKVSL